MQTQHQQKELFLELRSQLFSLRAADGSPIAIPRLLSTELRLPLQAVLSHASAPQHEQILLFPTSPGVWVLPITAGNCQVKSGR